VADPSRPPRWQAEWAERTEVLAAQIDGLWVELSAGEAGRAGYQLWAAVRNHGATELALALPAGFELTVASRDGVPLALGLGKDQGLSVPLLSREATQLIHVAGVMPFSLPRDAGQLAVPLPATSLPAARLRVRLLLPGDRSYALADATRAAAVEAPPRPAAAALPTQPAPGDLAGQLLLRPAESLAVDLAAPSPAPAGAVVVAAAWSAMSSNPAALLLQAPPVRTAARPAAAPAAGAQAPGAFREQAGAAVAKDPWQVLQATRGALIDRVNVGGNASGQQGHYAGPAPPGLHGRTTDAAGAALPGATITVSAPELPSPLVQVTNASGDFAFSGVAPGTYQLDAQLPGFSPVQVPGIRVATQDHGVQLEVTPAAAVEEVITVTSESPLLDEKAVRTGNALSNGELKQIPAARDPGVALDDLRLGLVGGVRPLPVAIPQTGKALLLAGVLPPARVAVELEVRPGAR